MTANRIQVGVLAVGLLVVLVAIGCSGSDDVLSSGNYVVTYPASTSDRSSIAYQCIRMDYTTIRVRPIDGVCSAASGPEFEGEPCGSDADCSTVNATCDDSFANGCNGGVNHGQICTTDTDCPGGICAARGECASFPGGMFTGAGCFSDLDCTPGSSEKCAGRCSAGSSNPLGACLSSGDCTLGECEGAQAVDTLGGNPILLIAYAEEAVAYFTPNCPACALNLNSPTLCNPVSPTACTNLCLPANQNEAQCLTLKCCQQSVLVALPCETDADCAVNECVDSASALPSSVLPEGKYEITFFELNNLLMSSLNGPRPITPCPGQVVSDQYDPPLRFEIGPGRANEIRFDMNLTQLESLLGTAVAADCDAAFGNTPTWFKLATN